MTNKVYCVTETELFSGIVTGFFTNCCTIESEESGTLLVPLSGCYLNKDDALNARSRRVNIL